MNVQEVFDKVIAAGYYGEDSKGRKSGLMCFCLIFAKTDGIITEDEYKLADDAIHDYLQGFGSLAGKLSFKSHDWDFETRLAIYKDWNNRPFGEV